MICSGIAPLRERLLSYRKFYYYLCGWIKWKMVTEKTNNFNDLVMQDLQTIKLSD